MTDSLGAAPRNRPSVASLHRQPWVGTALLLALMPAIAVIGYPSAYSLAQGSIDPWLYTGLIENYDELLERYGLTYYAGRIAHIHPAIFLNWLLGDTAGFYAYQYVRLLAAGVVVFMLGRRLYGRETGFASAAVACFSPWILFALGSDLYDGTATVYLLCAYMLALYPADTRWRALCIQAAAGVAVGMAGNVHQFVLGVFLCIGPAWLFAHRRQGIVQIALMGLAGAAGAAVGYFGLQFALLLAHPAWGNGNPVNVIIGGLLAGGARAWADPLSGVINQEYYYLLSPLLISLLALPFAFRRAGAAKPADPIIVALLLSVCATVFYIVWNIKIGGVLKPFVVIYLFPVLMYCAIVAIGEAMLRLKSNRRAIAAIVLSLASLILWNFLSQKMIAAWDGLLGLRAIAGFLIVAVAVMIGLAVMRRNAVAATVAFGTTLFALYLPYQVDVYSAIRAKVPSGWDVRRGADFLVQTVSRVSPIEDGPIVFWYEQTENLNMVQSAYFWGYSRVAPAGGENLPVLNDATAAALDTISRYAILTESEETMAEARAAMESYIASRDAKADWLESGKFDGEVWDYYYAIVAKVAPDAPAPVTTDETIGWLDLETLDVTPFAVSRAETMEDGRTKLTSHPAGGGFSALLTIPDELTRPGPVTLRIWMSTETGQFQVAATKIGDANNMVTPLYQVTPSANDVITEVSIPDLSEPLWLLFANAAEGASVGYIRAIEMVAREAPAATGTSAPDDR